MNILIIIKMKILVLIGHIGPLDHVVVNLE